MKISEVEIELRSVVELVQGREALRKPIVDYCNEVTRRRISQLCARGTGEHKRRFGGAPMTEPETLRRIAEMELAIFGRTIDNTPPQPQIESSPHAV